MANYRVFKETALPGSLLAHSIYLVAPAARPDYVEIYVTGAVSTTVKRVIDQTQVQALIDAAVAGLGGLTVVATIADRNALSPTTNIMVLVIDASADVTVTAGAATYVWRQSTSVWIKISEAESLDLVLSWASITGGPTSTPAQIDSAVSNSHTHTNKTELDKIGENGAGDLIYNGNSLVVAWNSLGW
jgi:Zn-dependent alcohol dehydrogenase